MEQSSNQTAACADGQGTLPSCAPLAVPYVPFQPTNSEKYTAQKGLVRGTLFPGLDLPYMGMVNSGDGTETPLRELMSMSFAITELGLYLDTHAEDTDALELFRSYVQMYNTALESYEAQYGPITLTDTGKDGVYNWLDNPWPWDVAQPGNLTGSSAQTAAKTAARIVNAAKED